MIATQELLVFSSIHFVIGIQESRAFFHVGSRRAISVAHFAHNHPASGAASSNKSVDMGFMTAGERLEGIIMSRPNNVGIHAMDIYFPRSFVSQSELGT